MKVTELLKLAVRQKNKSLALKTSIWLQQNWGMNYNDIEEYVIETTGIDRADWSELIHEGENLLV